MKRIISIKPILALITIALFAVVFKGCKKADSNGNEIKSENAVLEKIRQQIRKDYGGDVSASFVTPINKSADEIFYRNGKGKMESIWGAEGRPPQGCSYSCFNTSNPADLAYINYTLDYAERFYICETGGTNPANPKSNVRVKWTVTLPTTPDIVAGTNNTSNTFITLKFTNTGLNQTVTFNIPASDMQGKALGQLFNCENAFQYEITGTAMEIPNTYFQSGWVVSAQLSLDIFCPVLGGVAMSSFVDGPSFSQNGYLPCNRIDKVWITPLSTPAVALGNRLGISCTLPFGFQSIDYHQLEYRRVTSATSLKWDDQLPSPANGPFYGIPTGSTPSNAAFGPFESVSMPQIPAGTGLWLIRYRNVKTGTCDIISPSTAGANWGNDALWVIDAIPF